MTECDDFCYKKFDECQSNRAKAFTTKTNEFFICCQSDLIHDAAPRQGASTRGQAKPVHRLGKALHRSTKKAILVVRTRQEHV